MAVGIISSGVDAADRRKKREADRAGQGHSWQSGQIAKDRPDPGRSRAKLASWRNCCHCAASQIHQGHPLLRAVPQGALAETMPGAEARHCSSAGHRGRPQGKPSSHRHTPDQRNAAIQHLVAQQPMSTPGPARFTVSQWRHGSDGTTAAIGVAGFQPTPRSRFHQRSDQPRGQGVGHAPGRPRRRHVSANPLAKREPIVIRRYFGRKLSDGRG